jgi:hypothetical protein
MTWKAVDLPALRDGDKVCASLRFDDGYVCRVEVALGGEVAVSGEAGDLFEALVTVRRQLEQQGVLLGCNGCRRNVYPSPMLRQAGQGRRAYVLTLPRTATKPPTVDIFERAPDLSTVVTVVEQRKWFERWLAAPGPPHDAAVSP